MGRLRLLKPTSRHSMVSSVGFRLTLKNLVYAKDISDLRDFFLGTRHLPRAGAPSRKLHLRIAADIS